MGVCVYESVTESWGAQGDSGQKNRDRCCGQKTLRRVLEGVHRKGICRGEGKGSRLEDTVVGSRGWGNPERPKGT